MKGNKKYKKLPKGLKKSWSPDRFQTPITVLGYTGTQIGLKGNYKNGAAENHIKLHTSARKSGHNRTTLVSDAGQSKKRAEMIGLGRGKIIIIYYQLYYLHNMDSYN